MFKYTMNIMNSLKIEKKNISFSVEKYEFNDIQFFKTHLPGMSPLRQIVCNTYQNTYKLYIIECIILHINGQ